MQVGSIIRQIRRPDRLYLITEEMERYWCFLRRVKLVVPKQSSRKQQKDFEVIG